MKKIYAANRQILLWHGSISWIQSIGPCHASLIMLFKLFLNFSLSLVCTIFSAFSKTYFLILFYTNTIFEYSGLYVRAWRIENLGACFFMYTNTGLHTRQACSQFCARELPVRARMYADRVCHRVRHYVLYINIFLVLYYLTLYYI